MRYIIKRIICDQCLNIMLLNKSKNEQEIIRKTSREVYLCEPEDQHKYCFDKANAKQFLTVSLTKEYIDVLNSNGCVSCKREVCDSEYYYGLK